MNSHYIILVHSLEEIRLQIQEKIGDVLTSRLPIGQRTAGISGKCT